MQKPHTYLTVSLLLIIFAILSVTSIWPDRKSPTCDELAHHIPVGYVLLTRWDFKMDTSHPPLSRYIVALPLKLFMRLNMPDDKAQWRRPDRADFSKDFFYKYNNQPHRMIFLSRLAVVVIGLLCGVILFVWAKALYGERVALFSLFLYSFSPNILAHTRLATTDMVATCFVLLSVFSFWLFIKKPCFRNVIFAGICLGLAQLSKYSSLLLYPAFLILVMFEHKKDMILKLCSIFFVSVVVLWAGYGFDSKPILQDAMRLEEKIAVAHSIAKKAIPFWNRSLSERLDKILLNAPFPLGAHVLGVLGVLKHGYEGHGQYLLGKCSSTGSPLFFIVAFFIKTPIPAIIFLLTGLFVLFRERIKTNERVILITIALFFVAASFSKLQLGLRYILPIYPFFFILAGRSTEIFTKRFLKMLVILLVAWYIFSGLWIWPDFLSYFNETIGGPKNGYKYLRDSNIDWGQDLPALAKYMKRKGMDKVKLYYFGTAKPEYYDIDWIPISKQEMDKPGRNVYAVSVHFLDRVRWTKYYKPADRIGYSIFIYDMKEAKLQG